MAGWIDKLTVLITDKNLAVQQFIISQYVVEHFFIQVLGRALKSDFHPTRLLGLEVDVAVLKHERNNA